jgi:hypothetical protein
MRMSSLDVNDSTREVLRRLWDDQDVSIQRLYQRFEKSVADLKPAEVAILGRDLLVRVDGPFTPRFYLAAFLATESETANDGFLDFTDCVAILPEDRYESLVADPDRLIDDPVSGNWDEVGFVSLCLKRVDEFFGLDPDEQLLNYLVRGPDRPNPWLKMQNQFHARNAREWLPRLFERSGHILRK